MYQSKIYRSSPVWLQSLLLTLNNGIKLFVKESSYSNELLKILVANEKDKTKLENFTKEKLEKVLVHATTTTSFYKKYKNKKLIDFDLISKVDIKKSADLFVDSNYKGVKIKGSTSGTTGTPLTIYQNKLSVERERAFGNRHRIWAGYEKGDKRAWLRGDLVVPLKQKNGPFWRYSYFENMIVMSTFHLTPNNIPKYLVEMVSYGVKIIQAYPSSIVTVAKYLKSNNLYYEGELKSIITSSESLSSEDKLLVEDRFKCVVFDWYGLFERVAAIASCEYGRYHILTDYSYVELLSDHQGNIEIVGTNFNNSLYPLIRYKTGDYIALSDECNCPCGRCFPLIKNIEGRKVDSVIAYDGNPVFALDQCVKCVSGILGSQYIQDKLKEINVMIVSDINFTEIEKTKLIKNVQSRLGTEMKVNIVKVDSLKKTKNGKTIQAICNVKVNKNERY